VRPWLAQTAERFPDRIALSDGGDSFSYRELAELVARRAAPLAEAGVAPGVRVGLLAENGVAPFLAIHATFWRGATLVPFNPRLDDKTLAAQIEEIDPRLLLTGPTLDGPTDLPSALDLETLAAADSTVVPRNTSPDSTATIIYTSGTTGRPKPVPLSYAHHRASAAASAFNLGIVPDDRWLNCLPLFHVGGLATLVRSVLYGTAVELVVGFEPSDIRTRIAEAPVTLASFVPTMMRRLLERGRAQTDSLRAVLLGGGPAGEDLLESSRERGYPVVPTWGMTETASQFATAPLDANARRPGTVGPPLSGGDLRIVDGDDRPLDPSEFGRIQVRGPMVFESYLDRPALSRSAFVDGWFDTGDIGRLDARGSLTVETRASERIVTGGENIDPRRVESVLGDHPAVDEVCVLGLDDPEWGQIVVAALEIGSASTTPDALAAHCRRRLADFECPKAWHLTERLPRTGPGKLDRKQIRRSFDSPEREA